MSLSVINQWQLNDTGGYGPVQTAVANTAGNALMAFVAAGSDSQFSGGNGYCPRLTLSDDAHNLWQFAGTAAGIGVGNSRRIDVWICPNAMAAKVVNVSSNIIFAGMLGTVVEVTGFPQWAQVDFVLANGGFGTSWTLSGTATTSDFVLGAGFFYGFTPTGGSVVLPAGSTGTTFVSTSTGLTDMSQIDGQAFWFPNAVAAGAVSYTESWTTSGLWGAVVVGFKVNPSPPVAVSTNPNWPGIKVEAAFGWQPGSLGSAMPTWTDLTTRAIGPDGSTILKTSRGRAWELTQPEAGSLKLSLDNHDGGLSPPGAANVVPEVPVRVSAFWQGTQYVLGYWFANKWTQDFPDPQWGWMTLQASDAIGIASQGALPSAFAGQVLSDFAYSYHPLGEFYNSPHGALFANLSRTNQKPMVGYSPPGFSSGVVLSTGQTLNLAGDTATGIGVANFPGAGLSSLLGAPGVFVRDYSFPPLASGAAFEFWVAAPPTGGGANVCQVLGTVGMHGNYIPSTLTSPSGTRLAVSVYGGIANQIQWTTNLYAPGGAVVINVQGNTPVKALNHVFVNVSVTGTSWRATTYVNGSLVTNSTGTSSATMDWSVLTGGPVVPTGGPALSNNYAIGQLAVYPYRLPAQRINEHYLTGSAASNGDTVAQRLGKLFQWAAASSLPLGTWFNPPSPTLGPADQIQGSALTDALYAISVEEGGMFYAPASLNGEIWYATRTSLYNNASMVTLGDNPVLISNGDPGFNNPGQWLKVNSTLTSVNDLTAPGGGYGLLTQVSNASQGYARWTTPCDPTQNYTLTGYIDDPLGTGLVRITMDYLDVNKVFISNNGTTAATIPAGAYTFFSLKSSSIPANARFIQFGPTIAAGSPANTAVRCADFWLNCTTSEIPFDAGTGFDFSDQFLYNIVSSQRTASQSEQFITGSSGAFLGTFNNQGVDAIVADQASEQQYMSRGPLQFDIETTSDQDAYDRANWALAKYRQPKLRANQVRVNCAAYPEAFAAMLAVEQGDIVTINRRPIGAPVISLQCIVQKIEHAVGPNLWDVTLTLAPYFPENAVIQLDNTSFNQLQDGALAW